MRVSLALGLTAAILTASTVAARAMMIAPPPGPQRLVGAQCVVVGKVTAIEEKTIEASPAAGAPKVLYRVAVVKISDEIRGANGLTSIRVGFIPPMDAPAPGPEGGPRIRPIRRMPQVTLAVGQEALFFVKKHHEKDFYVAPMYFDVVNKEGNANFDKDVALLKKCEKLIKNPNEGLKSNDAEDRLLAAGLLISKYRTPEGTGKQRFEPIDAEQSKLILQAIADGDWSKQDFRQMSAMSVFNSLGLTPADGWKPGPFKNYQVEFPAAAKAWLKDNADKYRVKRMVAEEKK